MPTDARLSPNLLVSIREASELTAALAGADVVDVKEPMHGPLGMAHSSTICAIAAGLETAAQADVDMSVALGELSEWTDDRPPLVLPSRVKYVKLGLSGMHRVPDWQARWSRLRSRLSDSSRPPLEWIAVAYADAATAAAPSLGEVLDAAIQAECRGLLIDTFDKRAGSLCSLLSPADIRHAVKLGQQAGLTVALAGRIAWADVPELLSYRPDILGVRSLVCQAGDRRQTIDIQAVQRLRRLLNEPEA